MAAIVKQKGALSAYVVLHVSRGDSNPMSATGALNVCWNQLDAERLILDHKREDLKPIWSEVLANQPEDSPIGGRWVSDLTDSEVETYWDACFYTSYGYKVEIVAVYGSAIA